MANKDGIVSIGFDYKKELDEVCATIEKELNNLGGDINLSDGIKKQMAEVKKMITDMKKDIGSSFDKITETKLDTKTFESFKKDVNKRIREINKEVTTLKEQFSTLDGSANVNGIVQQFANLKKHVEDSNASISEFISNSEKLGKSVIISPSLDTDSFKNEIAEIKSLLTKLGKEDFDFGYSNKSAKELGEIARELVFDYRDLSEEIEETKSKLNSMNNSDKGFKEQEAHLSKLSLELIECGRKIDDVFGSENSQEVDWEKYLNINEVDEISKYVAKKTEEIRANAQQIINSIATSNNISSTNKNNGLDNTNRSNNIEVHISTKQSTINKQLDEMINNLQQRAANKPIIAPVKLRVDSEYEKTTKDVSASALTENQINEARKDAESVVPGLEKAFNNSMRIATNKAVENAKESIKAVREFFESNPITVHLTIPEDERLKIGKSILSEDGKTTVDISGQVDKARKSVKGLSEDLEKSQLLIKENAQNAKNLSLEKLVNSLSETMTQFSELKGIISSIQNMENTIARASGISSTNELVEQWNVVEKTIINATKLDGDFRKNANMGKIVSEYQKYIDMGGTNALSSINKIKDNEATINSILSKMKELKSQDIENSSIQKLSVDLDGVIAKFDELISTVKTATNALYKIIKQGSVSDLDKQWSSISNKFKSIADESGKINLSKQKTDIKELMDMYQKYENAGGANSLISLTDNVETLRKLDKEYQKLNQTQSVDNSSTIKKESESFKNVEKSVDSLTTAIGDTKVQAINVEATAMEDAAEREIMAIRSILDNLDLVVSRLKDIKGIKLPKIEVKNVDVVEKAVESLENAGNKSNISSENPTVEVSQNDEVTTSIRKKKEELASYELQLEETRYEIEKLSKAENESFGFNRSHTKKEQISSLRDSVTRNIFGKPDNGGRSGQKKWFALGDISNIDSSVLKSYQMWNEELSKAGYKLSEIRAIGKDGLEADIIPIDGKAITNAEEFRKALDNITTAPSENVELLNKQVSELESKISSLKAEIASLQSNQKSPIKDVFQGNDTSKINEVAEATNNLADAENKLNIVEDKKSAQKYWQGRFKDSISDITKTNDELVKMNKYYSDLEKLNEKITSAQNKVNNANIEVKKLEKRNVQSDDYVKAVDNYKNAITELQKYINNLNDNGIQSQDDIDELNRLQKAVDEVSKSINNMTSSEKGTSIAKSSTVFLKIEDLRNKYKGMSKDMLNELDKLERKFREAGNSLDAGKAIGELKQFEAQLIKTGTATNSLWSAMKNKAFYNFANQLGTMFSFYDLVNVGREGFKTIRELDTALVDLKKTTAMNSSQLEEFYFDSNDVAKQMGVTTQAIIEQSSAWSRLGYNTKEASTQMAELSSQFASISPGMDTEQSQEGLVSIMKAWDIDVSDVKSEIMDNINTLGNNFAETNDDIVEGMKRSAAALAAVGTSYEDSFALFTGIQEILQNSEVAGRSLRSISLRIRGYSEDSEDGFLETDESLKNITGDLIDLTKTAEHTQGVSIFKEGSTTEFKSLVEYFGEISDIWDEMSEKQQNDYLQTAFGKTQANFMCLNVQKCA